MQELFTKYLKGDRVIWIVAMFLALISLLAVYSSISSLAVKHDGGTMYYLFKHGLMLLTGGFIMYFVHKQRYTIFSKLSSLLIWFTAGLLLFTLLKGSNLNDASRWITIPGINQSFQTSDLAKVVLIVYLSRVLSRTEEVFESFQAFLLKAGLPVGLICGLIFPANFSTAALLFIVCIMVMFIAKTPFKYIAGLVGAGFVALMLLVAVNGFMADEHKFLGRTGTWEARMDRFMNGTGDRDANYQVEHAKIAIASGGLLPNGPGQGVSRNFLPHPYSDMIYAFIIEEYGSIIGGFGLMFLYLILFLRACHIANKSERKFGTLVAMGLSVSLVLQALINMAVAVNLVPVTGQPLPLVSMGGTSIWFTCLAIGILLSVSKGLTDNKSNGGSLNKRTALA